MTTQGRALRMESGAWQRLAMRLAMLRVGRIVLHVAAAVQDGQLRWHIAGIVREMTV